MDPSSPLHSEIQARLGVLPNFFRLGSDAPDVAANLWGFAKFGYLDNPLPALFKERLFVSLSRFCAVRYCISRHVGFLVGLGKPAGDGSVPPETAEQVVALLRRPLLGGDELEASLARLGTACEVSAERAPEPRSPAEEAVFDCAAHVFLQTPHAARCLEALTACFEASALQHLLVFLAFVRTAHFWTVVHPELKVERDITETLSVQEALAECVLATPGESIHEPLRSLLDERNALRVERKLRREFEEVAGELREERERLRVTLASIGDAVVTTDIAGKITNMNPVAEQLTGWRFEDAVGQDIDLVFRVVHESSREPADNPAMRALRSSEVQTLENHTLLITKDGRELPIDDSAAPIRDAESRILGCVLIFRDITERRERQRVSDLLAAIVESSDDAIISKGLDGVIQSWNIGAERLFGYRAEEAVGRHITMLIPPDLAREESTIISRIRNGERIVNFDTVRLHRSGRRVEVSETISPVKDSQGGIVGASKVVHDISDRREVERTLAQAARELAEADRRKERFLAILAHELRNPLSPLRSCIEVLKAVVPAGQQGPLAIMDRQVTQMVRLVDDLLDVARISRGQLELRKGRVNLQDVIRQAIESVQPRIDEKRLSVVTEGAEHPVELDADGARLTQVVSNLLTNAVKYSPEGGAVAVRMSSDREGVRIRVVDEGAGISEHDLERIFEMFGQVERSLHEAKGLGIGLTMARELVELHGGKIEAHSEGLGRGATFTVTLPPVTLPPATGVASSPVPAGNEPPRTSSKLGMKVLVVDDSKDAAMALALLLKLRGCVVETEFDGEAAIRAARDFLPTVVFLDIGMPRMSGLEVAAGLRREPWGEDMTLVALTGWGNVEDRERSKNAGFDEHLTKPADLAAIDRILSRSRAQGT